MRKSLDDLIFEQQKSEPSQEEKEGLDALIFDEPSKKKAVSQPPLGGSPQPLQEAQDVSKPSASEAHSTSAKTPFDPTQFSEAPKQPIVRPPVNQYSEMQKEAVLAGQDYIAPDEMMGTVSARRYEQSQKELVDAQKSVNLAVDHSNEILKEATIERRNYDEDWVNKSAVKLGHAQFKADENISKLKEAIKGDLDYLGSNLENFTRKSQEEDVIADEVKIDEYAREQARKKGLPEDGYYKNFLYNNAKAEVAQKIIEHDVLKEREKLFKEKTGKSIEDAFGEDFAKGFTKAQEIEATAKTQINSVAQEINALAKTETEEIARDVNSQIEQLNAAYQQQASQVTDQAQADALHQEYTANFNKLQANFLDAQNQINGKYNQRLRRQADEIEKVANQKWSEEAEKYKKDYKASPELLEQLKTVSQEAYKKVVNSKEKVKEVRDLYTPAISNYYRSTVSSLGRSLGNLSETVGYDYGKVLGDYMENTYQVGSAELNSWKDLLDASKLAKSAGQLTGAMLPSMTAAAATTIATQGLGAPEAVSMLAGGLAAWTGESMDMAGNIERETFAATGDANKALERSKRMWDAQMAIMPLYSLEMLPFMKGFGLSKNIAKRMAGGAAAEYVTEVGQEYLQNRYEAVINADKEFSEIFKDASWKEFGHTALNVAPVAILGAGGQIRGEKSEQEKINDEAKAFALKSELFDVAPDQRAQFISDIVREKGQAFTSAYISNLYTNGTIPKSSADLLVKAMGVALEVDAKAKEYGFNEAQKKVFTAFKYKLINAQEQAANETDPILKQAADAKVKELEEQTVNFASGKEADYIVMTYPNGEQYVLSVGQGQNAAKNPKLQQAVADGAIKLEGSGKGVEVVNSVGENIKANKKAKVEAEKAGLVAETWQAIQERIYIQNANYAQKEKQDKEQAAIENGEAASQFYELGTPEAKTVELSTEITPKVEAPTQDVAGENPIAQSGETETRETETPAQNLEESNIPTWHTEFERAKKENDLPAIDTLYNKVKVALNGLAQSKGEATVKEFETLKKDIEKYAEEWKKQTKTNEKTKKEDSPQIEGNLDNADKGKTKGEVPTSKKPVPVKDDTKDFSEGRKFALDYVLNDLVDVKPLRPKMTAEEAKYMKGKKGRIEDGEKVKNIRKAAKDISQRVDWKMKNEERHRAIRDIKKGKYNTTSAKMLLDRLEQFHDNGYFDFIAGTGGMTVQAGEIPIADIKQHLAEVKALKEEVYAEYTPEEVAYFAKQDAIINEMMDAFENDELNEQNVDEQLKLKQDENERAEKEDAENGIGQDVGEPQQAEAAPEKVLTEKEKAAKELADRIRKKKWGGANVVFDFGLTKTIYNFAVDKVADAVESGTELGKAIQQAVEWIESQMNGKEWDKKGFSDSFSDEGNDGKVPPTEKEEKPERQKKKKILGTRAYEGEISEEEKAYLEEKGLFRGTYSQEERSQQAQEYIDKFGEDAALRAVDTLEIRGAVATSILAKLLVSADIKIAQLENTDTEKLDTLQKEKSDITAIMEREGYLSGEMVGQLAFEYENSDLKFNVEKQIEEYKAVNNGKIPPETEAKFRELDKEITQLKAQIAEAEEKAKRAEEQAAIQAIQEKNQRDKKNKISEQKASEKIEKAKKKILEKVRSAKIHRPDVFMAATPASLVWDSAVEAVEQTINAGLSVAAAVARGVEAIQESEWYKGLERERQVEAEQALQDFFNEEERTDGRLKIPTSLIRDLVARGHNTIESLTQAVREAISEQYPDATDREIRDAITGYGKVANLNQEEIATQIRKITRLGRLMSQMEDIQARKRPMRSGIQRDKLDAEERAKMKEVREAMKDLPVSESDLEQQMKTALDAAKTRLQNQIEDLQREIDKGERVPKNARTVKDDRELTALKEKRDKVKAEHDAIFNNEEVRQAKRLELAKKAAERRIKDLERRIREQDFTKKKPTPLLLDTELIRLRAEKMRLQEEYEKEIYKAKIANRNNWEIAKETFWDLVGLGRLFNATLDASFVGVQGGIMASNLAVRNPKMLAEAFANMFRFALSEKKTEDFLRKLKAQDDYYKIKGAKLAITEPHAEITAREEHHFSDIGNMLWNLLGIPLKYKSEDAFNKWAELSPFKIFERAAIGFLDTVRVSKYMDAMQMLERQGKTFENDPQAFKNAADVVNTFTGRASLGFLEQQSKWLSRVFYSPRNWASVFKQTILFPRQITKWRDKETPFKPSVAQKMAVLDLSVNIATTLSMVTLAALYYGNDDDDETGVEHDPRSSDFGKIKIGNTRVDPWGGKAQQVVLFSRIIAEVLHRMYPDVWKGSYKTSDGDIVPLGTPYKAPTWKGLAGTMVSNKLNPATGLLLDYADTRREEDGELMTAFGQPYIFKDELKETYTPMITQTAKELLKDDPNALNGFLLATAYFGNSVNIYGKKTKKDILEKHEKAKENAKGDTKIKYEIVDKFLKENKAFIDGLEDEDFKDVMKNVKKEASAYANLSTDIRKITKEPDFKDYVEKVKGRPSYSTLTEEEKTIKKLSGADAVEYLFGKYKNEDLSKYPNNVSLDMTKYINNNVITAEERKEVISLIQKYQNNQK